MTHRKMLQQFLALINNLDEGDTKHAFEKLQQSLEYCLAENEVLRDVLQEQCGRKRIMLNNDQRRRLAVKAIELGRPLLAQLDTIFQPGTILGWHRKLVAQKYDSSAKRKGRGGRPMTDPEIVQRVVSLAKRNPTWGYDKLVGVFAHVGIKLSRSTVKRILDDHGIVPQPNRRVHVEWGEFVAAHQNVMAATDFFSVELLTPEGLQRCMVLFVIDIGTRRVEIAGVHTNPDGEWMKQIARNLTDCMDGFLMEKRYLVHDRDPLFTKVFDATIAATGVEPIRTAVCAPDMNAYSERFVQTIRHECLDKLVLTSEAQLRYVLREFLTYYHRERPHQGLGNTIIDPWPQDEGGEILEFERLGGLLRSYRRIKEAA